jgi:hypothetical protein
MSDRRPRCGRCCSLVMLYKGSSAPLPCGRYCHPKSQSQTLKPNGKLIFKKCLHNPKLSQMKHFHFLSLKSILHVLLPAIYGVAQHEDTEPLRFMLPGPVSTHCALPFAKLMLLIWRTI